MSDEDKIKALKVIDRWSEGIEQNADASRLARMIGHVDFHHFGDSACWKFGGDGDNLAYALSELIDQGLIEVKFL